MQRLGEGVFGNGGGELSSIRGLSHKDYPSLPYRDTPCPSAIDLIILPSLLYIISTIYNGPVLMKHSLAVRLLTPLQPTR